MKTIGEKNNPQGQCWAGGPCQPGPPWPWGRPPGASSSRQMTCPDHSLQPVPRGPWAASGPHRSLWEAHFCVWTLREWRVQALSRQGGHVCGKRASRVLSGAAVWAGLPRADLSTAGVQHAARGAASAALSCCLSLPARGPVLGVPQVSLPARGPVLGVPQVSLPARGPILGVPQVSLPARGPVLGVPQVSLPARGPVLGVPQVSLPARGPVLGVPQGNACKEPCPPMLESVLCRARGRGAATLAGFQPACPLPGPLARGQCPLQWPRHQQTPWRPTPACIPASRLPCRLPQRSGARGRGGVTASG
nr:uncharacterized protein LOC127486222 [Oryctolagus cuniculus]